MAVVLGGKTDPEVNFFIDLYHACTSFGQLPKLGGVLDQDAFLMYGLLGVVKAVSEKEAFDRHQHELQMQDQVARMRGSR
jgi:hypothetical protein